MKSDFKQLFKTVSSRFDSPHEKFQLITVMLIVFSIMYYVLYLVDNKHYTFSENIQERGYFTFLWYAATTNFTVPLGDVYPVSILAKWLMILHIGLFWLIMLA